MKKMNKKGFTLAELLVVVAIIGVLTAIAIPVFGTATTKATNATAVANVRAAYAEAVVTELTKDSYTGGSVTISGSGLASAASATNVTITYKATPTASDGYTIAFAGGTITVSNGATSIGTIKCDNDITISAS